VIIPTGLDQNVVARSHRATPTGNPVDSFASKLFYPLAELDVGRGADGNDCGDCEKGHLSSPELLSPSIWRLESTSPEWLEMASFHQSIGGCAFTTLSATVTCY
jgi:hypothetical protein